MKMYTKVLLSLLVTALVPLLLVTSAVYWSSRETLKGMAVNTLDAGAQTVARSAITLVESAAMEMNAWAGLETLQDVFTGEDIDLRMGLLLLDLQQNSDFLEVLCTDTNGRIVAASNFDRSGEMIGIDEAIRSALSGAPYISPVTAHIDGDGVSVPSICIAYPLRGAFDEETIIGAIAGYYDWRRVDERVRFQEEIAPQRGMLLLLMDASHQIVARGSAPSPVVELLQAELPGLHRDIEMRTHAVAGEAFDDSLQLLSMSTLSGELSDVEITYIGVAVAPERLVLSPVRRLAWLTALACLAATAGTLVLALFLSRQVSRPITALSTTAREIARGNLALEPPPPAGGEIGQLAADIDAMRLSLKTQLDTLDSAVRERTRQLEESVTRLQDESEKREQAQHEALLREQQLRQADKMVSLGVLVSGVAHEINNPNGLIALNLSLLAGIWEKALPVLERYYEENGDFSLGVMNFTELREQLPVMLADTAASSEHIKSIVDDLKGFSRTSDERRDESVDINDMVQVSLNLASSYLKKATRNVVTTLAEDLPRVRGNARRLEQVVINLMLNACDALESQDGEVRIVTRGREDEVLVEVSDTGRGIEASALPHITDPFFTTRRNEGGTGLGLSISAGIVDEHGGSLEFESEPGAGTIARMILPAMKRGESR
ncbi:MAG: HAMP domain-containing protein [Candidatus Hydrogenedentes bacterium]|nr:HAMP domain-containing protein [Candidatus Hydrogenedentota bacterium]